MGDSPTQLALIDADWELKHTAVELMNLLPAVVVDARLFMKTAAFQGAGPERPATLTVFNDAESCTKLRWSLEWTDRTGKRHSATSKYLPRLLWHAAAIEEGAMARKRRKFKGKVQELGLEEEE